jgi:hypothetical protein
MRRPHGAVAGLLALALLSGCYGPFYTVRKVWEFNGEVSDNKWIVEVVYLLCTWLPVYGLAGAADAIIFNSLEFWGAENPMAPDVAKTDGDKTRRIARGDYEAVLSRVNDELVVEQSHKGQPMDSLHVRRLGNGMAAYNGEGAMLFTAQTLPDGSVHVTDASGKPLATYSSTQVQKFLASVPQSQ